MRSSDIFQGIQRRKKMCRQARKEAYLELVERAEQLGANAVIGVRSEKATAKFCSNKNEVEKLCYGTAVFVKPKGHTKSIPPK